MKTNTYHIELGQLHLLNFRPLLDATVTFDPKLTVLIGANGAGKTSVLDCTAKFLYYVSCIIQKRGYDTRYTGLNNLDVNNAFSTSENQLLFHTGGAEGMFVLTLDKDSVEQPISNVEGGESFNIFEDFQIPLWEDIRSGRPVSIPVLAYYPCHFIRIEPEMSDEEERSYTGIMSVYDNALTGRNFSFESFLKWFDRQQKIELQQKKPNPILSSVKQAVLAILNDPEQPIFTSLEMEWGEQTDRLLIKKGSDSLNVLQLSSGEKSLVGLVADLARRLAIANPHSSSPLFEGSGIVLIDEIDLHLHPRWQRRVVPKLLEIFPKVQFVVTTHSPVILTEIASKHIRILDEGQVYGAEESLGRKVDYSLSVLMGDKPVIRQEFEAISEQIALGYIDKAEKALNKMVERIDREGDRGEDIPEVINLRKLIKRKRILLKS